MSHAIAVDFGASSGRFASGTLQNGRIEFEIIEQIAHAPVERNGRLEWDLPHILSLCRRAIEFGSAQGAASVGIDSWGVDHGFLDGEGKLVDTPVCYRDHSHERALASLRSHHARLYELTGIQHQPFNTICQLVARREEDPTLIERAADWMILPDLLGYLLSGDRHHEITQASTTQLLGLDGQWSAEAFAIAGWPTPSRAPRLPGGLGGEVAQGMRLAHVGSHDTASAVAGFGRLHDDQLFLNVGTWSLIGTVIDHPIATPEAEAANFTNERTVDGRVRFLKNVPGFYVVNRIHAELGISATVPEWLRAAAWSGESVDLLREEFFNPDSMVGAIRGLLDDAPVTEAEWAGLALRSLTDTLARQPKEIARLTGRTFRSIRVGGGGSQSAAFCQALANSTGLPVEAGPSESTVLGNLGVQFLATGQLASVDEMFEVLGRSADRKTFEPESLGKPS